MQFLVLFNLNLLRNVKNSRLNVEIVELAMRAWNASWDSASTTSGKHEPAGNCTDQFHDGRHIASRVSFVRPNLGT